MMESTQAMRATVPQIQMVPRSQLRDGEVDLMKGFHLGGPEDIGSGWKMPPTGETFDAGHGRWVASRGTPDRGTHRASVPKSGGTHVSQFSIFPSPTTRRSILLINSALRASAAFMSDVVCFKVLVFDPKATVPPTTAAIAPIMTVALNPTAPIIIAKIRTPPALAANFETRMIFRQLSTTSASSSMYASMRKICSCRSPLSSL